MDCLQGDGGSPLVCHDDLLMGIGSFGTSNCDIYVPAVFTKVSHYKEWIDTHMTR